MNGIINVDLTSEVKQKLAAMADQEKRTMTVILQRLIEQEWQGHEAKMHYKPKRKSKT